MRTWWLEAALLLQLLTHREVW